MSRLILDAGAHVLVDEADLWEDGEFPTTVLLVRAEFLEEHPDVVEDLLEGHVAAVAVDRRQPRRGAGRDQRARSRPRPASRSPTRSSRGRSSTSTFSVDPHADTFETLVANGLAAGTQKDGSIDGLFDLRLLNGLLEASGRRRRLGRRTRRGIAVTSSARRASGVAPSDLDGAAPGARVPNLLGPSFDSVTPVREPAPAVEPAVRIEHVGKRFGDGPLVLDDITLDIAPGRVRVPARRVRLRQVDAAQPHRRARPADRRAHRDARRRAPP